MDATRNCAPITSIVDCFIDLEDPRVVERTLHKLIDIVVVTICAVISGANTWKAVEAFGYAKYEWLGNFLELPNGVPSHQTFGRVFSRIRPLYFHNCFMEWVNWAHIKTEGTIINFDGKTSRRSRDKNRRPTALHLINAFATANGICIGQYKTPDKTNEIKAIPPLLKMLEISGCIITMDAMGTQKGIANLIRLQGADYVLAVKGNQGNLHKKINNIFEAANEQKFNAMVFKEEKTLDGDHGRVEERTYQILPLMYLFSFKKIWKDLQTFIKVENRVYENGKETINTHYYISSLPLKRAKEIVPAIRQHWHVENKLHWRLDIIFREDESRVRRGYAAENLSLIRKMCLNILDSQKKFNAGKEIQRLYAGWSNDYLSQVVGF